jgi:hypothetical protein
MEGGGAIFVLCQVPARSIIRKQVHVQNSAAAARTEHRGLFLKAVLFDNIKSPGPELFRQGLLQNDRSIRPNERRAEAIR